MHLINSRMRQPTVILATPDYFEVVYKINPWMDPAVITSREAARHQWLTLLETYELLGAKCELLAGRPGLPDMCFSANGFFAIENVAVLAKFKCYQRQAESQHHRYWLETHGFQVVEPEVAYEGEGDTLKVSNRIYQGFGFRSDYKVCDLLRDTYRDYHVKPLRLVDERFYHLDIALLPIHGDRAYYYPGAFDEASVEAIEADFLEAVPVTEEEILSFGLNAAVINGTVIMSTQADKLAKRLREDGLDVLQVSTSEFVKAGGSVKCLTNELYYAY